MAPKPLTISQIKAYPASASAQDIPQGKSGVATVAKGRGGPLDLYYEQFGTGDIKIAWISGHGGGIEDWFDYVKEFGLDGSNRYNSLLLENRGIGRSQSSWTFWSMNAMALDTFEVLDKVGWTTDHKIHVVGHSMGGMIAMEMAKVDPSRIASLTLVSTTADWSKDVSVSTALKNGWEMIVPRGEDGKLNGIKSLQFGDRWLAEPDEKGIFPTNGDHWTMRFLAKPVHYKGAIMQGPAFIRHRLKAEDFRKITHGVGGSKIRVVHGRLDRMVPLTAAQTISEGFGGTEAGVKLHVDDHAGHMTILECFHDVAGIVRELTNTA